MGFYAELDYGSSAWTVSELTTYIKELFEIDYRLHNVEVAGELSNFTRAGSGHLYFTLKDEGAQLKCVMWRSSASLLTFVPQEGDAVVARGRVSVYETGGVYQLYAEYLEPAGRGNLALAFERLKERLAAEGIFDVAYKKPLPRFPKKIGIVTSADAAALRDILTVLGRRNPLVSVLVAPTLVQGDQAPPQIVAALQWLDGRDDIDLLIIARGGGSIEDLWAFNDERVARAIFAARHPVICGVGHETDFTIADFVADVRAPTPSAAAELAVPDLSNALPEFAERSARLRTAVRLSIQRWQWQVNGLAQRLSYLSPAKALDNNRQRLDELQLRIDQAALLRLERLHGRLALAQTALKSVGPMATLARGYAIVRHADRSIVRSTRDVHPGDRLTVQVKDGNFPVAVEKT